MTDFHSSEQDWYDPDRPGRWAWLGAVWPFVLAALVIVGLAYRFLG